MSSSVNLGAGGFVSYLADGGATVEFPESSVKKTIFVNPTEDFDPKDFVETLPFDPKDFVETLPFYPPENFDIKDFVETLPFYPPENFDPKDFVETLPFYPQKIQAKGNVDYEERGVDTFFKEQYVPFALPEGRTNFNASKREEIRASGSPGSAARGTYYPEGDTFFEQLAANYGYPLVKDSTSGPNRFGRPREDLPTPQELADARAHALGTAMVASEYGPNTAEKVGIMAEKYELPRPDPRHSAMDIRNNAVGVSLFKQAGINATPAQLAKMVDAKIFQQLEAILKRAVPDRRFESDQAGMDLYFPRDQHGYFVPE